MWAGAVKRQLSDVALCHTPADVRQLSPLPPMQLSFLTTVYPSLVLTYLGQAAMIAAK